MPAYIVSSNDSSGAFAVLTVHEDAEDLLGEAHGAHVSHGREIGVPHAVENGKSETHERNVFVARDVFPVGVADQQVHAFLLDPLMQQEHVGLGALADLSFGNGIADRLADAGLEALAGRAGHDVDRTHVQRHQELGERNQLVGIAEQSHAFPVEVLVHVGDHVHQAAAFVGDEARHADAGAMAQRVDEAVRGHAGRSAAPEPRSAPRISLRAPARRLRRRSGPAPAWTGCRPNGESPRPCAPPLG